MWTSTIERTPRSRSSVVRVSARSASVSRVTTSTTRKARGARGAGSGLGFGGSLRTGKIDSDDRVAGASSRPRSSGTTLAPVPLVAVSRTQVLPTPPL
jgi:hypothetical protein